MAWDSRLARMQSRLSGRGRGLFRLRRRAGDVVLMSWRRLLATGCGCAGQAAAVLARLRLGSHTVCLSWGAGEGEGAG